MRRKVLLVILVFLTAKAWSDGDEQPPKQTPDLTKMSLEALMDVEVTTASKHAQPLSEVPAAMYVITQDDIRHSGATNLPDLLRMVPGVQVAQISAHEWAISIRGFNSIFADKLLVLIDGRSVYTPMFSGVYWDMQDVLLEDIERIEVIRGPGGSLWGANAVNGIINIITKHAKDTQGSLLTAGFGSEDKGLLSFRHGGAWGDKAHYRVFGKYFKRDDSLDLTGARGTDEWSLGHVGFRFDREKSPSSRFMLQGDVYSGDFEETTVLRQLTPPFSQMVTRKSPISVVNVLARWDKKTSERSERSLQIYYERTKRDAVGLKVTRSTFDVDFQKRQQLSDRHTRIWGVGYRRTSDDTDGTLLVSFNPADRTYDLWSAFVHDEITLKNNLRLTIGSKFEHNDFSGFEFQPNVRLAWTPDEHRTAWASISRAVQTPSRADHGLRVTLSTFPGQGGTPTALTLFGDPNVTSEDVLAYELGYRWHPNDRFFMDVGAFYNVYQNVMTAQMGTPFFEPTPAPPHLVLPLRFESNASGRTYGIEVASQWSVTDRWRLAWAYSHLGSTTDATFQGELNSPRSQFHIRSNLDLPGRLEFDTMVYAVGRIRGAVPSYTRVDARLGWKPKDNVEISVGVQNLLNARHQEFGSPTSENPHLIQRSVYGKVTWRF